MKWVSLQRLTYTLQKIEARYALQTHSHPSVTTNTFGFMSPADKVKLNGISTGANKYTHPSYTQRPSGLYKVTVDTYGHVSAAEAVTKADITALGIPAQDTTYSAAMQSANGLMSVADKTKLDGMPASGVYGEEF